VAACDRLTLEDLAGPSRRHALSACRIVAAHLARERLGIPVSVMARLFRREETGLAHGVRSLEERVARDSELKKRVDRIAKNAKLPA
jgi:chromosomal replication initiation ATPase DnaA